MLHRGFESDVKTEKGNGGRLKKKGEAENINIILLLALVLVLTALRALTGKVSGVPHFALKARFYLSFFFRRLQTKILEGAKYIN
jgi:hypothetical protein